MLVEESRALQIVVARLVNRPRHFVEPFRFTIASGLGCCLLKGLSIRTHANPLGEVRECAFSFLS